MQSLPPGFVSRVAAVVLAGALVFVLQDDLAERLASPPDPPVLVVNLAATPTGTPTAEQAKRTTEAQPAPDATSLEAQERKPDPKPTPPPVSQTSDAPTPDSPEPERPTPEISTPSEEAEAPVPENSPATVPAAMAAVGCRRMVEFFEAGEKSEARREAEEILAAFTSHADVTVALADEGISADRARLWTILALHLAGDGDEAREQARLARASHPGDDDVAESLRRWNILRPRIVEVSSFLNEQQKLVLKGSVRNEDIGAIRKVRVRGEALDGVGNVIAAMDTRVKPRLIGSDVAGEFEILFKNLADHEQVKRTRATVIGFEYEVATNR